MDRMFVYIGKRVLGSVVSTVVYAVADIVVERSLRQRPFQSYYDYAHKYENTTYQRRRAGPYSPPYRKRL